MQPIRSTVDVDNHRFPHCIVWTPIPPLTWLIPIIGHMGIALRSGIIRDFAGSRYVSEDCMAFDWPTSYWQLDLNKCPGGSFTWDNGVTDASNEYGNKLHYLLSDNCHSHVSRALTLMQYKDQRWNSIKLVFTYMYHCKYVNCWGWCKQWVPFLIILSIILLGLILWPVFAQ